MKVAGESCEDDSATFFIIDAYKVAFQSSICM